MAGPLIVNHDGMALENLGSMLESSLSIRTTSFVITVLEQGDKCMLTLQTKRKA